MVTDVSTQTQTQRKLRKVTTGGRIALPELAPYTGKYFTYQVHVKGNEIEIRLHILEVNNNE